MLSVVDEESEVDDSRTSTEADFLENNEDNSNHHSPEMPNDRIDKLNNQFSELVTISSCPLLNEDVSMYFFTNSIFHTLPIALITFILTLKVPVQYLSRFSINNPAYFSMKLLFLRGKYHFISLVFLKPIINVKNN